VQAPQSGQQGAIITIALFSSISRSSNTRSQTISEFEI